MRISSDIMLKTRARCPCCGTRLNENALDREIDFTDERGCFSLSFWLGLDKLAEPKLCEYNKR